MKDNILCIFIMLFVSVTFNANAQKSPQGQFSVKGVLVDSLSNEGEPYSTIRISLKSNPAKPVKLAVTDTNGKFSERLVSPGTYLISFSSVGKRTVQKEFTVSDTKKVADLGHIQMAEATEMLKGVEVVAQKPLVKAEIDKVTYSIEDDPDSKTNSTLEMLRKVPLVTVDGEDKIQVNGSSNFKVHVNGKPNNMMSNNPTEVLKSLPANSVKSIEVITDPGAKYDAEGVGGILNIITTGGGMEGYTVTLNGGVSNRGYNASGYGTVQIGKFTVTGNYAYNHNTSPRSYSSSGREDFTSDDYKYLSSESSSKHKGNFQYGSMEGSYEIDTLNLITFSMNMFGGKFKNNGYDIVLDVNSGAIHVVDDVTYDVIALFEDHSREEIIAQLQSRYPEQEIAEAIEETEQLKEQGDLFTEDAYEQKIFDFKKRPTVVKALCLHIAHDCNLACRYCFAEEGEYHGRRALMSYETGKQALDFLIANSGNRKNLEVDFFGGEPLMNFDVVKQLVAYGREQEKLHDKHFRFTLTTNGVLLNDDIMEFANKEMDNVVLSIDGRKEIHDHMRPFRKGAGSYDLIVPKFQKFAESRNQDKYYVRGTFTHNNLDFSNDVLHLADLGFKQISVEPVVAQPTEDYAIREEDLPQLYEEYDKLAAEMVKRHKNGNDFNFFHFMIDLEGGPCVAKRLSGCGSGTEYLAVTPWGDLYPCHQFVGNEDFLLGNVDEGIKRQDICDEFKCCNVYAKEKCRNCFAKFYCSGGCAVNSYNFHGDIHNAYDIGCALQKKRIECAIMIKAAEADEE